MQRGITVVVGEVETRHCRGEFVGREVESALLFDGSWWFVCMRCDMVGFECLIGSQATER